CFTTIQNYTALKQRNRQIDEVPCFTTIQNYTALKPQISITSLQIGFLHSFRLFEAEQPGTTFQLFFCMAS
ncbi:MAG: hypothetical protein IKS66_08060, partial [Oscillospiraceae bacterium]|nr:hypothetical protein [Oscillospiraceae bacterium]